MIQLRVWTPLPLRQPCVCRGVLPLQLSLTAHITFIANAEKLMEVVQDGYTSRGVSERWNDPFSMFYSFYSTSKLSQCLPAPQQFQGPFRICIAVGFLYQLQPPPDATSVERYWTTCWSYSHSVFHDLRIITFSRLSSESWFFWVTFRSLYSKYECKCARARAIDSHSLDKLYVLYASI